MAEWSIRTYRPDDLLLLQEITALTFGPVSIDRNMEQLLGPFGAGGWQARKLAAIADDCRAQPDGVFVAEDAAGRVVGYVTTRLNVAASIGWIPNLERVAPLRTSNKMTSPALPSGCSDTEVGSWPSRSWTTTCGR